MRKNTEDQLAPSIVSHSSLRMATRKVRRKEPRSTIPSEPSHAFE
jgi:hypothetical protein